MKKGSLREWIIAVSVFLFSLVTLFYLIPSQIEITEEYDLKSLSPAFFPEVSAYLIGLLSMLFMISLFQTRHQKVKTAARMTLSDEIRVLAAIGIAVIYVLGFKYMGFIPASILVLGALFWLQGKRSLIVLVCQSVGTVLFVYFVFYYVMKVRFPEGLWWH